VESFPVTVPDGTEQSDDATTTQTLNQRRTRFRPLPERGVAIIDDDRTLPGQSLRNLSFGRPFSR
jgi:hypothetical protein